MQFICWKASHCSSTQDWYTGEIWMRTGLGYCTISGYNFLLLKVFSWTAAHWIHLRISLADNRNPTPIALLFNCLKKKMNVCNRCIWAREDWSRKKLTSNTFNNNWMYFLGNLIPGIVVKRFGSKVLHPGDGINFESAFQAIAYAFVAHPNYGKHGNFFGQHPVPFCKDYFQHLNQLFSVRQCNNCIYRNLLDHTRKIK